MNLNVWKDTQRNAIYKTKLNKRTCHVPSHQQTKQRLLLSASVLSLCVHNHHLRIQNKPFFIPLIFFLLSFDPSSPAIPSSLLPPLSLQNQCQNPQNQFTLIALTFQKSKFNLINKKPPLSVYIERKEKRVDFDNWASCFLFYYRRVVRNFLCIKGGFERRMRTDRWAKRMGRISRIGSFAIASSIKDNQQQPCITCTTFNILAPIYKRLNHEVLLLIHANFWERESKIKTK